MRNRLIALAFTMLVAASAAASETESLHKLFDDEWQWQLRDNPEGATLVGDARYNDKLFDRSEAAFAKRRAHDLETLKSIDAIDRAKLSGEDQLNYDIFRLQVRNAVESDRFPYEVLQIDQMGGIHAMLSELAQGIPKERVKDFDDFLARMRAYPKAIDDTIALLRRGLASGVTPPRVILRDVPELIGNQIVDDPTKSPIYDIAFANLPASFSADDKARLQREAAEIIRTAITPAMKRLHDYMKNEYVPKSREAIGFTTVPNGKEWYALAVRQMTTTELTPDEIHALGLSEVKRIRAEMERIKEQTGFKGSLAEFFEFLRTDKRFFFTERDALLSAYRDIAKRIDPELMKLFGTLPRTSYGVIPVPSYSEKTQTTAYYNSGSPEGHRPGYYYANLYDLPSRPKWEMEALTLHEAVPGHHLQISLAQELTDVPNFRRHGGFTAFVEGWGLYAESLGPELGMYKDPYAKFGQLTYEMWRAVRLVVDTGMHAKGWTRDQAIQFFVDNASKSRHDIEVEIDRYLAWPGQALAYKIGELKMKELRAYATRELGDQFDIRAFHDQLLGAGPLPMSILEARTKAWVKSAGAKKSDDVAALLEQQTQELVDAVGSGDANVWNRYLDDRVTITAEDGTVYSKAQMVGDIRPLPQGVSGAIKVTDFHAVVHGDVATTTYVDDEDETYYGHALHCQYRTTDTWKQTSDGWRLIASQVLALRTDPPAIATATDVYVGKYTLTPEITYEIRQKDGKLEGQRAGRPAETLLVEAPDVLFVPGKPRYRKIFQRDAGGKITGFAERREAWDLVWTRVR
ncbi:MAG TPA: DUF885 family protein [Thermoanaerobaculia bacterium]|nr:DUF885 family protein [Thermoanaerobaculia bacterium]